MEAVRYLPTFLTPARHCERSEAIQPNQEQETGWPRYARNDERWGDRHCERSEAIQPKGKRLRSLTVHRRLDAFDPLQTLGSNSRSIKRWMIMRF